MSLDFFFVFLPFSLSTLWQFYLSELEEIRETESHWNESCSNIKLSRNNLGLEGH